MTITPSSPLYTIPIKDRPSHGPLFSRIFFPIFFTFAQLFIAVTQACALPLLLIPFVGHRAFRSVVDFTKDGYGRCLIAIIVLFAPHSFVITTNAPPSLPNLIERDSLGRITKMNLPDRLVIMANHQAYTDWMYMWILACYSGNSAGLIILLKASLKNIPLLGWGMQAFRFIFMHRSWAADREHLTKALTKLAKEAKASRDDRGMELTGEGAEGDPLLPKVPVSGRKRSPLWLLIFPEGTITSDEERVKSVRYAKKEEVPDFVSLLHPRSTGLLFCLRTLLPQVPDLKLMDVTIAYPGVPYGKYPQDYYGLFSIFLRSVPPPTVHLHIHIYENLSSPDCVIPSLITPALETSTLPAEAEGTATATPPSETGLASPEEARRFELWLRSVWEEKEKRLEKFFKAELGQQRFVGEGGEEAREVMKLRQTKWYHWISAVGGGGAGTLAVAGMAIRGIVMGSKR